MKRNIGILMVLAAILAGWFATYCLAEPREEAKDNAREGDNENVRKQDRDAAREEAREGERDKERERDRNREREREREGQSERERPREGERRPLPPRELPGRRPMPPRPELSPEKIEQMDMFFGVIGRIERVCFNPRAAGMFALAAMKEELRDRPVAVIRVLEAQLETTKTLGFRNAIHLTLKDLYKAAGNEDMAIQHLRAMVAENDHALQVREKEDDDDREHGDDDEDDEDDDEDDNEDHGDKDRD